MFALSYSNRWACVILEDEDDDEYEDDKEGNLDVYLNCRGRNLDFVKRLL
jgi:hypothetical protein